MTGPGPFGPLLRAHRRTARLTLEELAEASGVSVRGIGDPERGRSLGPRRRTVVALAEGLRLPPAEQAELLAAAKDGRLVATGAWSGTGRTGEQLAEILARMGERREAAAAYGRAAAAYEAIGAGPDADRVRALATARSP